MKTTFEQMTNRFVLILGAGAVSVLGACEHPPSLGPGEADFGNAVRHNIQAQVVNPTPTPEVGNAAFDGRRAARNIERYAADKVKKPSKLQTSDVKTSDGAGGGGNQ